MVTRVRRGSSAASRNVWEVIGYDGLTQIFRTEIPVGQITRDKLYELLRVLVAKYGALTNEEVVGSLLKRGTRRSRVHLDVYSSNDDAKRATSYTCGENPHFVARLRGSPGEPSLSEVEN